MLAKQIREIVESGNATILTSRTVHGYWIIEAFDERTGRYHQLKGIRGALRQFRSLDALARCVHDELGSSTVQLVTSDPRL